MGLRFGASATIAPTFRSRFGQPSSRRPMPLTKESSTVEWHSAHVMPIEVTLLSSSSTAFTPTTASARSNSRVVSGLSRLTPPSLSTSTSSFGTAPTSAFRPSCNACRGVSPGPTPPFFSPRIALCSWSWSPQNASLPNVS